MAKMSVVVLVLLSFCAIVLCMKPLNDEELKKMMATSETCRAEVGASQADVEEAMHKQPPSTMEGKCMHLCMMKSFGLVDANGKLNENAILEKAKKWSDNDPEMVKKAVIVADACKTMAVSENPCEAATQIGKCIMEQAKANGIEGL